MLIGFAGTSADLIDDAVQKLVAAIGPTRPGMDDCNSSACKAWTPGCTTPVSHRDAPTRALLDRTVEVLVQLGAKQNEEGVRSNVGL